MENRQEYFRAYNKARYNSLEGFVRHVYHNIAGRCKHRKLYIDRGIECKFTSSDNLIDYVINELQIDPRGLECHRIDDNGHYEKGNIIFLTNEDHKKIHVELRSLSYKGNHYK